MLRNQKKQRIKVALKQTPSGQWAMAIWLYPVIAKPNASNGRYMLADFDMPLEMEVDCDGIKKKPQLILKLICKLNEFESRKARRSLALAAAREGSPMLW